MFRRFAKLGKEYSDGDVIARQGEKGDYMYVVEEGEVQAMLETPPGIEIQVEILKPGDIFGEMVLFTGASYAATYIARGVTRVISIDKGLFLKRISEDPSLAFHMVRELAMRIQKLEKEIVLLKSS